MGTRQRVWRVPSQYGKGGVSNDSKRILWRAIKKACCDTGIYAKAVFETGRCVSRLFPVFFIQDQICFQHEKEIAKTGRPC